MMTLSIGQAAFGLRARSVVLKSAQHLDVTPKIAEIAALFGLGPERVFFGAKIQFLEAIADRFVRIRARLLSRGCICLGHH